MPATEAHDVTLDGVAYVIKFDIRDDASRFIVLAPTRSSDGRVEPNLIARGLIDEDWCNYDETPPAVMRVLEPELRTRWQLMRERLLAANRSTHT